MGDKSPKSREKKKKSADKKAKVIIATPVTPEPVNKAK